MKVNVTAGNGAEIVVWREGDTYFARRASEATEPQICLAVDLFEVIAELAALDLERQDQAAEALALAEDAQRQTQLRGDAAQHSARSSSGDAIAAEERRGAS